jgi:hypothetical protein
MSYPTLQNPFLPKPAQPAVLPNIPTTQQKAIADRFAALQNQYAAMFSQQPGSQALPPVPSVDYATEARDLIAKLFQAFLVSNVPLQQKIGQSFQNYVQTNAIELGNQPVPTMFQMFVQSNPNVITDVAVGFAKFSNQIFGIQSPEKELENAEVPKKRPVDKKETKTENTLGL